MFRWKHDFREYVLEKWHVTVLLLRASFERSKMILKLKVHWGFWTERLFPPQTYLLGPDYEESS